MEELIGALGIALVAVAIGMLWNSRMNAHVRVATHPKIEPDASVSGNEVPATRFRAMPGLAPALPADAPVPAKALVELPAEVINESPIQDPITKVDQLDHEDVEVQLQLAFQLQVIGDFEGAAEYAQMVSGDDRASSRQVDRAQSLLRRESVV